jgi:hypothetical protein
MPDCPHLHGVPFAKKGCLWKAVAMIQAIVSASFIGEGRAFRTGGLLLLAL